MLCLPQLCFGMELKVLVEMVPCLSKRVAPIVCSLADFHVSFREESVVLNRLHIQLRNTAFMPSLCFVTCCFKNYFLERLNSASSHVWVSRDTCQEGLLFQQSQRVGREQRGEKDKSPQGHVLLLVSCACKCCNTSILLLPQCYQDYFCE